MIEATVPTLEYAPPVPPLSPARRALRVTIYVLTGLLVIVVVRAAILSRMKVWAHGQSVSRMLKVQDMCLHYDLPPGRRVFDGATGQGFRPAAYDRLVQSLRPSFDRGSLGFDIGGGVMLLHQVVSSAGKRVLMIANIHAPTSGLSTYMLRCYQVELGDWQSPAQIDEASCPLAIVAPPLTRIDALSGHVLPGDPSRFDLPLLVDGNPLTVHCRLRADGSVAFSTDKYTLLPADRTREGASLYIDRFPPPQAWTHTRDTWRGIYPTLPAR
ncbi:MAG: hypothetical protein ACTHLZ_19740 [Tepidisphaeraceae bacterium]